MFRGVVVLLAICGTAQGSQPVCHVTPAQKQRIVKQVQNYVAPVVKNHVRQQVNYGRSQLSHGYSAPQLHHGAALVCQSYSGLDYSYDPHGEQYYYTVGDDLREDAIADRVYLKLAKDGALAAIIAKIVGEHVSVTPSPAEPTPAPEDGGTQSPGDDSDIGRKVAELFRTKKCFDCHSESKKKGGLVIRSNLSLESDSRDAAKLRFLVLKNVKQGEMPMGLAKLTDTQVDLVEDWANEDL